MGGMCGLTEEQHAEIKCDMEALMLRTVEQTVKVAHQDMEKAVEFMVHREVDTIIRTHEIVEKKYITNTINKAFESKLGDNWDEALEFIHGLHKKSSMLSDGFWKNLGTMLAVAVVGFIMWLVWVASKNGGT